MESKIKYVFKGMMWQYPPPSSWYFISVPIKTGKEIRNYFKTQEQGWGRLQAVAAIGSSKWETAIWYDTRHNTYLLPIKAEVRKKQKIQPGLDVEVSIWV